MQPLITDDTGTQGARGNQIEAAYSRTAERAPGVRETSRELEMVLTRGITDALDLYAGGSRQKIAPQGSSATDGWSNPAIGAKWRFQELGRVSYALKPEVRLSASTRREAQGLGSARTSYGVALLVSQETGFGAVHFNVAFERERRADAALDAAERRARWRASVAPVWDITDNWKLALDAGVETNPDRAARPRMGYVEIGAVYSAGKDLDVAAGLVRNVSDGAASTTRATLGVTARFR